MVSCNVKALITLVPVDLSISIAKDKLQQGPLLPHRTSMSIQHIITLLEFCLKNTCFLFLGKYIEQVHDAAKGFPISPPIAICEWKSLNQKPSALSPIHLGFGFGMWMTPL